GGSSTNSNGERQEITRRLLRSEVESKIDFDYAFPIPGELRLSTGHQSALRDGLIEAGSADDGIHVQVRIGGRRIIEDVQRFSAERDGLVFANLYFLR